MFVELILARLDIGFYTSVEQVSADVLTVLGNFLWKCECDHTEKDLVSLPRPDNARHFNATFPFWQAEVDFLQFYFVHHVFPSPSSSPFRAILSSPSSETTAFVLSSLRDTVTWLSSKNSKSLLNDLTKVRVRTPRCFFSSLGFRYDLVFSQKRLQDGKLSDLMQLLFEMRAITWRNFYDYGLLRPASIVCCHSQEMMHNFLKRLGLLGFLSRLSLFTFICFRNILSVK